MSGGDLVVGAVLINSQANQDIKTLMYHCDMAIKVFNDFKSELRILEKTMRDEDNPNSIHISSGQQSNT